ncbi:MAG: hypothetical protein QHC90_18055 [Shinella sp.]|nr:hypothetical protein [Shinella sp.]
MKVLVVAIVSGIAALGLWSMTQGSGGAVDPIATGSIATVPKAGEKIYSISNVAQDTACLAERGEKLSTRSLRFSAGQDCDRVWPGLSRAKTWTENGDGTVILANSSGEAIITIAESDGLAYEALEPANALLTMTAAD